MHSRTISSYCLLLLFILVILQNPELLSYLLTLVAPGIAERSSAIQTNFSHYTIICPDLEDVLTLQTKLYRCAHIFLGKCLPPVTSRRNPLLRTAYGISPDRNLRDRQVGQDSQDNSSLPGYSYSSFYFSPQTAASCFPSFLSNQQPLSPPPFVQ